MSRSLSVGPLDADTAVQFSECFLDKCGCPTGHEVDIGILEHDNGYNFLVPGDSDSDGHPKVLLSHSPVCPFRTISSLPESKRAEIQAKFVSSSRQIKFATVVLVEDELGRVLLSRRLDSAVIFPSVWVLPGGHVEVGETLAQAGARELEEETGIRVNAESMRPLMIWESAYPAALHDDGPLPRSHHLVMVLHVRVSAAQKLRLQASEVAAAVWADRATLLSWLRDEEACTHKSDAQFRFTSELVQAQFSSAAAQRESFVAVRADGALRWRCAWSERLALGHRFALSRWLHMKMLAGELSPPVAAIAAAAAEVV